MMNRRVVEDRKEWAPSGALGISLARNEPTWWVEDLLWRVVERVLTFFFGVSGYDNEGVAKKMKIK
jgi:hypothetical protein